MKEIIHNEDNLTKDQINKTVQRAKAIIINSKDEISLANSHKNYFLIGGHLDEDETLEECLIREIKEETGITLSNDFKKPFLIIRYLCKDYPNKLDNTEYITSYFAIKTDQKPNLSKIELTEDEKDGSFHIETIPKNIIIKKLEDSLKTCTKQTPVKDTILAIKEYLKNE